MRSIFDGTKKGPHPEEPAKRASRRTQHACPATSIGQSEAVALLRRCVFPIRQPNVIRKIGENLERTRQALALLAQNNLIAAPENLYLVACKTKLPRQAHHLTIPRTKDSRDCHTGSPRSNGTTINMCSFCPCREQVDHRRSNSRPSVPPLS